jgi:hypothetical protein
MHWLHLAYPILQLSNPAHCCVGSVGCLPCDYVADWELWLTATAQHGKRVGDCISLAREKIQTKNSKYVFFWILGPMVKKKNCKSNHHNPGFVCIHTYVYIICICIHVHICACVYIILMYTISLSDLWSHFKHLHISRADEVHRYLLDWTELETVRKKEIAS